MRVELATGLVEIRFIYCVAVCINLLTQSLLPGRSSWGWVACAQRANWPCNCTLCEVCGHRPVAHDFGKNHSVSRKSRTWWELFCERSRWWTRYCGNVYIGKFPRNVLETDQCKIRGNEQSAVKKVDGKQLCQPFSVAHAWNISRYVQGFPHLCMQVLDGKHCHRWFACGGKIFSSLLSLSRVRCGRQVFEVAEQVRNVGVLVSRLAGVGFGPGFGVSRCKLNFGLEGMFRRCLS